MIKCKLLAYEGIGPSQRDVKNSGHNFNITRVMDYPDIEADIEKYLNQGYLVKNITAGNTGTIFVYLEKNNIY